MILKKDIIIALGKKLSLPYTGTEQDWDIEMADSSRINEFIDLYHQHDLAFEERMALMSLIAASYDVPSKATSLDYIQVRKFENNKEDVLENYEGYNSLESYLFSDISLGLRMINTVQMKSRTD